MTSSFRPAFRFRSICAPPTSSIPSGCRSSPARPTRSPAPPTYAHPGRRARRLSRSMHRVLRPAARPDGVLRRSRWTSLISRLGGTASCRPRRSDANNPGQQIFVDKCAACHAVRGLPGRRHPRAQSQPLRQPQDDRRRHTAEQPRQSRLLDQPHADGQAGIEDAALDLPPDQVAALTAFLEGLK